MNADKCWILAFKFAKKEIVIVSDKIRRANSYYKKIDTISQIYLGVVIDAGIVKKTIVDCNYFL